MGNPDFVEQLCRLLSDKNLTKADVARRLEKSYGYVHQLTKGLKPPPKPAAMERLASVLNCTDSERSLLMGYAFKRAIGERGEDLYRELTKGFKVSEKDEEIAKAAEKWTTIPLLGVAPAGPKSIGPDEVQDWLPIRRKDTQGKRLYLLRVRGDSMNRAGIEDGDLVVVNAEKHPNNGEIAVIRVDGEATIKRFYPIGKSKVKLVPDSDNPTHDPTTYDAKRVEIMFRGVVEAVYMKKLK